MLIYELPVTLDKKHSDLTKKKKKKKRPDFF